MRVNDDRKTVAAMDVLVPKVCFFLLVIHYNMNWFCLFISGYKLCMSGISFPKEHIEAS